MWHVFTNSKLTVKILLILVAFLENTNFKTKPRKILWKNRRFRIRENMSRTWQYVPDLFVEKMEYNWRQICKKIWSKQTTAIKWVKIHNVGGLLWSDLFTYYFTNRNNLDNYYCKTFPGFPTLEVHNCFL